MTSSMYFGTLDFDFIMSVPIRKSAFDKYTAIESRLRQKFKGHNRIDRS